MKQTDWVGVKRGRKGKGRGGWGLGEEGENKMRSVKGVGRHTIKGSHHFDTRDH